MVAVSRTSTVQLERRRVKEPFRSAAKRISCPGEGHFVTVTLTEGKRDFSEGH